MGMLSKIEVEESIEVLEIAFKESNNFKVRQRIQSLIHLKKGTINRQIDLVAYLDIGHSTLKSWIK
ncbi:hypothetical protein A8C32_18370 [Flavivirga aquatica]|uniref:Uncharacterized protein n=1 Tax=Flavivirga aquatica TaxID=1849968 RepID=A0A1E5T7R5_9FLAO|nr:hypothetical protein [Flavivirga aquatica]OEK07400.1 hypothetical protein A8C32_18370 [Flavivirga aquatica]